jgi:hypothetical protein
LTAEDALSFLTENAEAQDIVLYASLPNSFINTVVIPAETAQAASREELSEWNFNGYTSWGITVSLNPPKTEVSAPLHGEGIYSSGEPLIFARSFQGRTTNKHYHEPLQKFVQISGIHYVDERSAYCRFDRNGDYEDVIAVHEIEEIDGSVGSSGTIVTCKRETLDRYLALTRMSAVRMFDFTRLRIRSFAGWNGEEPTEHDQRGLSYRQFLQPGHAGYVRGYQIVNPKSPSENLPEDFQPGRRNTQNYASFVAQDWRHGRIAEVSCKPGATANYFNAPSLPDLPFELSPAFFRPEVLAKYKADSEKYRLDERTITCRDAWHLQNYDINEAGQVHTYLVYLRNLPFEEQMYWRSFNEPPKTSISRRAFLSDFQGSWNSPYDPLESIKSWARDEKNHGLRWWRLKAEHLIGQTRYPVTSSADEWANEILHLDQLLVEGFEIDWLRAQTAQPMGSHNANAGSINLMTDCLAKCSLTDAEATNVMEPFKSLHYLRTKLKGHAASTETLAKIRRDTLKKHGSYSAHFRSLCEKCDKSLQVISQTLS